MAHKEAVREGLAYLAGLAKFGMVPTLDRIRFMMQELGDPHRSYGVVHVAGTNGKGSTARMIAQILQEAGLTTGLFSSPHLEEYNERIAVQGENISDDDLLALLEQMRPLVEKTAAEVGHPTEFEMSTAMAFLYFAQRKVDIAVIEVGMGGEWDSTNIVDPMVSVITPIGMDHTDRLGNTLGEIAAQKAGIIKNGRAVVIAPQKGEALAVLLRVAAEKGADLFHVTPTPCEEAPGDLPPNEHIDVRFEQVGLDTQGGILNLFGLEQEWRELQVGLLGSYQLINAAVAATASQVLARQSVPLGEEHIRRGLREARWPGRLELLQRRPTVILDGAHNEEAVKVLTESLKALFPQRRILLVIGALAEKPIRQELEALLPVADVVVCTAPSQGRTPPLSPEKLVALVKEAAKAQEAPLSVVAEEEPWAAVQIALKMANSDDLICVCGSLYLVGEIRRAWRRA